MNKGRTVEGGGYRGEKQANPIPHRTPLHTASQGRSFYGGEDRVLIPSELGGARDYRGRAPINLEVV